ncbi:hypothetical protein B1A_14892 [mine drainage metagenome]|uniref:Uncharacterized protein n=1 Tax=mine drainage metagenome TaxID=410659 RepID=T0ZB61_9ZZZZ
MAIAARFGLDEPGGDYLAVEYQCWRCAKRTPIFFWPGIGEERPAPRPWPRTVKPRYSQTLEGRYLANGCVHCDALVGDFYLSGIFNDTMWGDPDHWELHKGFFGL